MVTALATAQRAPADRHRPGYGDLLDLLADARAAIADADEATFLACFAVHVLANRAPERPCNTEAERRVLGAIASGRATLRDVASLIPGDFLGDGHLELFAALVAALRQEQAIGVRVRPSARRDPAMREHVAAEGRRRRVGEALVYEGAFAAWVALQGLPRPAACPRRDIVRVEELARWRKGER